MEFAPKLYRYNL